MNDPSLAYQSAPVPCRCFNNGAPKMSATKFHVGERVEDKKTHERGRVTFVTARSSLETSLSRSFSTATTKHLLFRLTAFAKSQRGSHGCRSDLNRGPLCPRCSL